MMETAAVLMMAGAGWQMYETHQYQSDVAKWTERGMEANLAAMGQWQTRQSELFEMQKTDWEKATQWAEAEAGRIEPLREEYTSQFGDILRSPETLASNPAFAGHYAGLRSAGERGRQNILENMPAGGQRERALMSLETSIADSEREMTSGLLNWVYGQAQNLGITGYPMPSSAVQPGALGGIPLPGGGFPSGGQGLNMAALWLMAQGGKGKQPYTGPMPATPSGDIATVNPKGFYTT